jgi:predicted PurR-regulated permease PerM
VRHLFFLIWVVIGIVLLTVATGFLLSYVLSALLIMGLAALVVFILRVPVAWMERRRIPRWLGSLIAYIGALLLIASIILIFIPIIGEQALGLIKLIPDYITQATTAFNDFYQQYSYLLEDSNIQQMVGSVASDLSSWAANFVSQSAQGVITLGTNVVTSVVVLFMSLIIGYWILVDLPRIGREARIIIGPKREKEALFIVSAFSRSFGGYLRGITVAGLCTGTIAGIGYYFIGLPYPAVLGLLTGLMNFIPYVGPWIAGIITACIGLFVSPLTALLTILITVVAQQVTDNFIMPRVMSSIVELHPAVVLMGVFVGGIVGGIPGMIVAIPLLSALKNIYAHYFEKRTGRFIVDEDGAFFKGRPSRNHEDEDAAVASEAFDEEAALTAAKTAAATTKTTKAVKAPSKTGSAATKTTKAAKPPTKVEKESREK